MCSSTIGGGMTPPSLDICHVMVFCTCVKTEKNQNKERKKESKYYLPREYVLFIIALTICIPKKFHEKCQNLETSHGLLPSIATTVMIRVYCLLRRTWDREPN